MTRSSLVLRLCSLLLCCAWLQYLHVNAQSPAAEPALTVEEIVKLTHSGFTEEIIVTKIKKNAKAFDLNGDELLDLKRAGVSEEVIKYMLDPSLPYTPPLPPAVGTIAPTKPHETTKKYPLDAHANGIPAEAGLYFFPIKNGAPARVELKFLLGTETPKSLLKKKKVAGYLIGQHAKAQLTNSSPTFYVRLPEGKEIEELVLVNFSDKNDRRELELGSGGPAQGLNSEDIRPRDSLEVGPRLFKINTQQLEPGEYLFLFMGSTESAKGIFGKGYDFGVPDPADKKSVAGKRKSI